MLLRIDGIPQPVERRLWAPLDPHTTRKSRPCASCHSQEALRDTFPAEGETTREKARLLDSNERLRVLRVGKCVTCHDRYEDPVYAGFEQSMSRLRRARDRAAPAADAGDAVTRCKARPDDVD